MYLHQTSFKIFLYLTALTMMALRRTASVRVRGINIADGNTQRSIASCTLPGSSVLRTAGFRSMSTTTSSSNFISSFSDALSDLWGGDEKRKRRRDELDSVQFRVTRLNDTMVAAKATLLDAVSGPAAGDAEREVARTNRTRHVWKDLLQTIPPDQQKAVAPALQKFQDMEIKRKERLRRSLQVWRERELESLEKRKERPAQNFFSKQLTALTEWRKQRNLSPQKLLGEQLKNESRLFRDLAAAGVSVETIQSIARGASTALMDPNHSIDTEENIPTAKDDIVKESVYVLDFKGDMRASKVKQLSEEISAILSLDSNFRPSEVILRLSSPGGTVTGYGRGSAELARLVKSNISLTACVDEVAASGGYLMACVAQKIYAAPLAAIGSIGVVASTPNVAKRMKEEGVQVIQSTAGKYKRTVTPWKEPSPEEMQKVQEDVDTIQKHFVNHVKRHRGSERIPDALQVATGEVWYGSDAVEKGLVDDLLTSEEYIQRRIADGCEVLHVQKVSSRLSLPWWLSSEGTSAVDGSLNLPKLQWLDRIAASDEDQLGVVATDDEDQLHKVLDSLPVHKRRTLVHALLHSEC